MAGTYVAFGAAVIIVGLGLFYRYLQYRQARPAPPPIPVLHDRPAPPPPEPINRPLVEAERRYAELKRQFDDGTISVHEFNAQRHQLMVQDDEGRWWAKSPINDEWNYYDGSAWVPGTPSGYQEVTSEPTDSPAQTLSPPPPKNGENGHLQDREMEGPARQDAERGTGRPRSRPRSRLPSTEDIRPVIQGVVTIVGLGVGFWIILGGGYPQSTEQWATGLIGLVVGFWLKA